MASSLSAGAQALIQLDDFQLDGPVRPKATLSAVSASVQGHTPPTERDFVRQQRLKRFSSNASDKSNSEMVAHTTVERMTSHDSTGSSLQSPGAVGVVESSTEKTGVFSPLSPNFGVFDVGNVIQVDRPESTPWYGVIKWIGHLGESTVVTAGIEMVRDKLRTQNYLFIEYDFRNMRSKVGDLGRFKALNTSAVQKVSGCSYRYVG